MKSKIEDSGESPVGIIKVKLTFPEESLHLKRTPFGTIVELEGCANSGEPGGPSLPSKTIRLALPVLTSVSKVTATAVKTVNINKKPELIAPLQLPQPGVERRQPTNQKKPVPQDEEPRIKPSSLRPIEEPPVEPYPAPPLLTPMAELYEREAKTPRPVAQLIVTERVGPVPIAVIGVNPVRLTKKGLLEFASEIEVEVEYERRQFQSASDVLSKSENLNSQVNRSAFIRKIHSNSQAQRLVELARERVLNAENVWDFSPLFPVLITQVDYLIITDNQKWDETTATPTGTVGNLTQEFQRLADWKAKRGLKTFVVKISDIVGGVYGNFTGQARDLQEVIRNFLKWAYDTWGISWVLLGGDINIIPVRRVAGAFGGHIETQSTDPPPDDKSYWTGAFLKMKVVYPGTWWPGPRTDHLLVRADNGLLIPYDPTGTSGPSQPGWYFCTSDTYTTRTATPTQFVRVNGSAAIVNTKLQWLYYWNTIPTDLYYSSLQGPSYGLAGLHDWDLLNNHIYGQHSDSGDLDGVEYETDISVGRAPVSTEAQANSFVDKVIAYEQFRKPDGSLLDSTWPSRMLIVSSNWGHRVWIEGIATSPPGDNKYNNPSGANYSIIRLKDVPKDLKWQLIAQINLNEAHLIPYDRNAASTGIGWHYAKSATDLSISEFTFSFVGITFHFPTPTHWVVTYGGPDELTPQAFIFDSTDQDTSMRDQEQLRVQVDAELPGVTNFSRLYEDEVDLTPSETAAAPIEHLSEDRLRNALNAGPHTVSLTGHGTSNGCCYLSGNMAQNLINQNAPFIAYADSCLTNQFDDEDAVSEILLYNPSGGAVAYVGNTRFSWIGVGDDFQRAFFHRLTSTRHLGLLADTRVGMVNAWTGYYKLYNKWVIFALNLMGDPEMPVWTGKPKEMKVSFQNVLDKRDPFTVTVKTETAWPFPELPLLGAVVHIKQNGFSRIANTNIIGQAVFDLNIADLGPLEITVTKTGYLPFIGEARIAGPSWVRGQVIHIGHQEGTPHRSVVRLHLDKAINGDEYRGWYAHDSRPDYAIILDAVTDAYVSDKKISLFVDILDEGGTIERFRFGFMMQIGTIVTPSKSVLESEGKLEKSEHPSIQAEKEPSEKT